MKSENREKLFEDLVMPHCDYLKRFAITVCRDPELAGDVLQEALFLVWKKLDMILAIEGNKKHYICTMILNIYRNDCRKRKRDSFMELRPDAGVEKFAPQSVEGTTMANENKRELLLALNRMRPEYARLILLHYYYGRGFNEIAEILGVNQNTVASWHSRAKKQLADILLAEENRGVKEHGERTTFETETWDGFGIEEDDDDSDDKDKN